MTRAMLKRGYILELHLKDGDSLEPGRTSRQMSHELDYDFQVINILQTLADQFTA